MAELALHRSHVAELLHDMDSHGVPRAVRRPPLDPRGRADLVPDLVDGPRGQPSPAVGDRLGGEEQGRGVPSLLIDGALLARYSP